MWDRILVLMAIKMTIFVAVQTFYFIHSFFGNNVLNLQFCYRVPTNYDSSTGFLWMPHFFAQVAVWLIDRTLFLQMAHFTTFFANSILTKLFWMFFQTILALYFGLHTTHSCNMAYLTTSETPGLVKFVIIFLVCGLFMVQDVVKIPRQLFYWR